MLLVSGVWRNECRQLMWVALLAVPEVAPGIKKPAPFLLPWAGGCEKGGWIPWRNPGKGLSGCQAVREKGKCRFRE